MNEEEQEVIREPEFQKRLDGPKDKDFVYPDNYKEKYNNDKDIPVNTLKFQYIILIEILIYLN